MSNLKMSDFSNTMKLANISVEEISATLQKPSKKKGKKEQIIDEIKNNTEHTVKKTIITDKTTYYIEKKESKQVIKEDIENGYKVTKVYSKEPTKKIYRIKLVKYNEKEYGVSSVIYETKNSEKEILFVFDYDKKKLVEDNRWHYAIAGKYIMNSHYKNDDGERKGLYLHNAVMNQFKFNNKSHEITVDHINRHGCDNRCENLRLASQAEQNYNQKKRLRNIDLSEYDIIADDIPKCVWLERESKDDEKDKYLRFVVEIAGITYKGKSSLIWKTTKSEKYSLKAKLEMAKKFINSLFDKYPELYNRGIITEYTPEMIEKIHEFNDIIKLSGYPEEVINNNLIEIPTKQKKYLDINYDFENETDIEAVKNFNPEDELNEEKTTKRKFGANMPIINGEQLKSLPKYTYFSATTDKQGCKFTIERHPGLIKQQKRSWSTTTSKGVSIEDKYADFLEKLDELDKIAFEK